MSVGIDLREDAAASAIDARPAPGRAGDVQLRVAGGRVGDRGHRQRRRIVDRRDGDREDHRRRRVDAAVGGAAVVLQDERDVGAAEGVRRRRVGQRAGRRDRRRGAEQRRVRVAGDDERQRLPGFVGRAWR